MFVIFFFSSCSDFQNISKEIIDQYKGELKKGDYNITEIQITNLVQIPNYFSAFTVYKDSLIYLSTSFGGSRFFIVNMNGDLIYNSENDNQFLGSCDDLFINEKTREVYVLDNTSQKIQIFELTGEFKRAYFFTKELESSYRYIASDENKIFLSQQYGSDKDLLVHDTSNKSLLELGDINYINVARFLTAGGGLDVFNSSVYTVNIVEPLIRQYDFEHMILTDFRLNSKNYKKTTQDFLNSIELTNQGRYTTEFKDYVKSFYFDHSRIKNISLLNKKKILLTYETGIKDEYKHYISFIDLEKLKSFTFQMPRDVNFVQYANTDKIYSYKIQENSNPSIIIFERKDDFFKE